MRRMPFSSSSAPSGGCGSRPASFWNPFTVSPSSTASAAAGWMEVDEGLATSSAEGEGEGRLVAGATVREQDLRLGFPPIAQPAQPEAREALDWTKKWSFGRQQGPRRRAVPGHRGSGRPGSRPGGRRCCAPCGRPAGGGAGTSSRVTGRVNASWRVSTSRFGASSSHRRSREEVPAAAGRRRKRPGAPFCPLAAS